VVGKRTHQQFKKNYFVFEDVGTKVVFGESFLLVLNKKSFNMKKMILSLFLIGSSAVLFAQIVTGDTTRRNNANVYNDSLNRVTTDSTNRMNQNMNQMNKNTDSAASNAMRSNDTLSTNRAYSAYGATSVNVPSYIQSNLQKDYPTASNITWQQNGEWYHGMYGTNGRYTHVYYNTRGATYSVSLPVTQTYVPDDVVSKVGNMFGPMIYDITTLKGDSAHNVIYQVRTVENGQVKAQWIGEDGSTIADPFRSDLNTNVSTGAYSGMDSTKSNMNMTDTSSMRNMNNNMNQNMNQNLNNNRDSSMNNNVDSSQMNKSDSSSMNNMNNTNNRMDSSMNNSLNSNNNSDSSGTVSDSSGNMNQSGQTKTKTKTKTSDGKKTVIKSKSGEMKPNEE
jgi:hypothetical protein